ncbi:MAG: hypothetical protein CVV64_04950 [Candidatus Wallbacteria bacterium HGW-Wallbacteria-1]|uniref:DUF2179 domain-containing protein n=1 Tax=Candidatus Wallbacteria bacterium HGW-Wallbacteria-1 TaxID=2013854 RepID=A0A2N1PT80_9BACT|nr:MAG: hypothetical protein CVV64_04950 [Candidatus Wallbacteria bacterium HGW-Wallbacteria-1]
MRNTAINSIGILVGAAIMGFGINCFNIANNLSEGGVTGLSIILKLAFDIDPGLTTFVVNVPLLIVGWRILGKASFFYTIYGTLALSFFLSLFGKYRLPLKDDLFLASLFAGLMVGIGLGIILRFNGTTGGVDILARLFYKSRGWQVGKTIFIGDVIVICGSLFYLDIKQAMYTLVAVYVATRIIDLVQEGAFLAKAAFIISSHSEEIASRIMNDLERGTTILKGKGAFTGRDSEILYVVIGRRQMMSLKNLIEDVDPLAFVTFTDVHEVMGEGFSKPEKVEAV